MTGAYGEEIVTARGLTRAPRLSVLTPFHRDDPTLLIRALARSQVGAQVELVLLNDGGGDAALLSRVLVALDGAPFAARVVVWGANRGRSAARNRLIELAQGRHALFLDADMIPESGDFLERWLDLIAERDPQAAFGGFTVARETEPAYRLHRAMADSSDCRDAQARAHDPAQFTATSNLLVRRDLLCAVPFDDGFKGWGWEDVDWALRAAERAEILHIDNPARHAGLDDVDTLLRKFRQAGPNYARLASKHPAAVARFRSHQAARFVAAIPGALRAKPLLEWLARDPFGIAPLIARRAALKLYRTAIYAEHLP